MAARIEKIGNATLYLGDCREILPGLERPAAVITDPPYGQKYKPSKTPRLNGCLAGVSAGSKPIISQFSGVMVGDDALFDPAHIIQASEVVCIFGAHKFSNRLPEGQWLVWDKVPTGKTRPHGDGELAWVKRQGPVRIYRHLWDGFRVLAGTEENARQAGTSAKVRRFHPTQKPVALMRWCIEKARVPAGGLILDPYMGSGSTGVAAMQLGHPFTGIEIDPGYFDVACRRIEAAARQGVLQPSPAPVKP